MKHFNMKHLAVAICVATCIHASPVQAAWFGNVKASVESFIQNQVKPALQKPETYAIAAAFVAAGFATYCHRDDIYWAFKNELPLDRAQSRVRSRLSHLMKDRGQIDNVYDQVVAEDLFTQHQGVDDLIQKNDIDVCVYKRFMHYEFSPSRSPDWASYGSSNNQQNSVQIIKHAVRGQGGLTCGYHAIWNGVKMYALLKSLHDKALFEGLYDALQVGPPIQNWKGRVQAYENTLWTKQQETNSGALLRDSKQSNYAHENISDGAVEHLLDTLKADLPKEDVTVVSNVSQYSSVIDENLSTLINNLKNNKSWHVFIIGNMVSGDCSGTSGHWVAMILEHCRNKELPVFRMHTADSLGSDCESQVNRLVQILIDNGLFEAEASSSAAASSSSSSSSRIIDWEDN